MRFVPMTKRNNQERDFSIFSSKKQYKDHNQSLQNVTNFIYVSLDLNNDCLKPNSVINYIKKPQELSTVHDQECP